MKQCSRCKETKLTSEFYSRKTTPDGLRYECKKCNSIDSKNRRIANLDSYKERRKLSYLANRETEIANALAWQARNPEKHKANLARWRSENTEHLKNYTNEWRANHPGVHANNVRKRKAKIKNNGVFVISEKELRKLYLSDCLYCGSLENITADHVIPINKGGRHSIGNLVPACLSCNSSKRDLFLMEWKYKK